MLRLRQIAWVGSLGLLVTLIALVVPFVLLRGHTPPILDSAGRSASRSIARLEWVTLGGTQQAILLRGVDTANPVVLFLHGGPGMPAMYLAHAFQRPLETEFVMVQWDRRGAGKSYDARVPPESLTVRRTLDDLYELTGWLRVRFNRDRIYLVAHSWGTSLGLAAVTSHPEWYHGYIGMAQLVPDTLTARAVRHRLVLEEARRRGKTAVLARLAWPGAAVAEDDLFAVGGELRHATNFWPLLRTGLLAPEYTLFDVWNVQRGAQLLLAAFGHSPGPALPEAGTVLSVPVFLFLGRYDYNTPSAPAASYLDSLTAPMKGVVWFEQSAHFPFFEEPERFRRELNRVDSLISEYWLTHGTGGGRPRRPRQP